MQNLKGSAIIALGIVLASIILPFSLKAAGSPGGQQPVQSVGRYQLVAGESWGYVLDTTAGRVWWHNSHQSGSPQNFFERKNDQH